MNYLVSFTSFFLTILDTLSVTKDHTTVANNVIGASVTQAFLELVAMMPIDTRQELTELIEEQNSFADIYQILVTHFGEMEVKKVLISKLHTNLLDYLQTATLGATENQKSTIDTLLEESNLFNIVNLSEVLFSWLS